MMNQIERLMDNNALKLAEYVDIEVGLLQEPFLVCSVQKLVFISFCVFHQRDYGKRYNQLDITQIFFQTLSGKLLPNIDDLDVIFLGISLLENNDLIHVNANGHIVCEDDIHKLNSVNQFIQKFKSKNTGNPILAVNRLDDKAFLEEVIRYV